MKNSTSLKIKALVIITTTFGGLASYGQSAWVAPSAADKLINPLDITDKNINKGKQVYEKLCSICHGKFGAGDGPAGKALNPRPADHTSKLVQKQSDGAIYWKISSGKEIMPAYKDLLSKTERWQLTQYIRKLGENNNQ